MEDIVVAQRQQPQADHAESRKWLRLVREDQPGDQELRPRYPFGGRLEIGCQVDAADGEDRHEEGGNDHAHEVVEALPERVGNPVHAAQDRLAGARLLNGS
jgi:hypothetical protein